MQITKSTVTKIHYRVQKITNPKVLIEEKNESASQAV